MFGRGEIPNFREFSERKQREFREGEQGRATATTQGELPENSLKKLPSIRENSERKQRK